MISSYFMAGSKKTASCPTSLGSFNQFPPHLHTFVLSTMDSNHGFQALQVSLKSSSFHQDTTRSIQARRAFKSMRKILEKSCRVVQIFGSPAGDFLDFKLRWPHWPWSICHRFKCPQTPRDWVPLRRHTVILPEGSRRIKNRCFAALFSLAKNSYQTPPWMLAICRFT